IIQNEPDQVYSLLHRNLNDISEPVDLILLEVDDVHARVLIHIALALLAFFRQPPSAFSTKHPVFCVLLPVLPCPGEDLHELLSAYIESREVIFIDLEGKTLPNSVISDEIVRQNFRLLGTQARALPLD